MSRCVICDKEIPCESPLVNGNYSLSDGRCVCKSCAEKIGVGGQSVADELTKLKTLLDQGVLTQEEFAAQKEKILNRADVSAQTIYPENVTYRQSERTDTLGQSSKPPKRKKKLHIFSWIGVVFFGLLGLAWFPSVTAVLSLLMVVYLFPIGPIRAVRNKYVPFTWLRIIVGVALFFGIVLSTPDTSNDSGSETGSPSVSKSTMVEATATTVETEPKSPYETVFYIDFVRDISDYDGKKVEITVPVDSVYSDGDISVSTSSKIGKRISIETGNDDYYDNKDKIKFITVRGIAKNDSSEIEIKKPEVVYAGPDAPSSYLAAMEEYESMIVQGKIAERDEFISNSSSVTFEDLRRNPDTYEGKPLKMTIQVKKVDVDGVIFNGAVWASYNGNQIIVYDYREIREPRLMAGDTITIYAEGNGFSTIKTYEKGTGLFGSDLGANVVKEEEVPCVKMKYTDEDDVSKFSSDTSSPDDSDYYNNKGRDLARKLNELVG